MKRNYLACIIGIALIVTMLCGCGEKDLAPTEQEVVEQEVVEQEVVEQEVEEQEVAEQDDAKQHALDQQVISFSTTDINGESVSIEDFSDAKVIMINFWEPWCGPCVREMPDLERIYEEYKSAGLVILGVFSTEDMDEEAREVLDDCGTTYPILRYVDSMEPFITEYVPTTIFVDSDGNVLTSEPIVGGDSYDGWKQTIETYMNR